MKFIKTILFVLFKNVYLFPSIISHKMGNFFFNYPCDKKQKFLIDKNNDLELILNKVEQFYLTENKNEIEKIVNFNQDKKKYSQEIDNMLSNELKTKLSNFLSSKNFLNYLSSFFGYKLKFNSFLIRLNFFNASLPEEEGPKMWHRDNDSFFGQIKLFSVINQLDINTGGFFSFIPQKNIKDYECVINQTINKELSITDRLSRIINSEMSKIINLENEVVKFGANKNEFLAIDTNDTYHKGGYLSKSGNIRLLLQVIYEPYFNSLSNYNRLCKNNSLIYNAKIFFTGLKNRLRNKINTYK